MTRRSRTTVIGALWRSTHPGPTLVVTALAALLGAAAALPVERVAILACAVFLGQVSVGLSNDAIDVRRDRASGRADKPLVHDTALLRLAWLGAVIALAGALALSLPLGGWMAVVHAVTLTSAWSYNAGLKGSPVSVVPFVVSFGLFPSLVTLSADHPAFAPPWATFAGAAFGVAVHFTNVVPDLADDARTGIRGLPHRLGARAALISAFATVAVAAVAVLWGSALDAGSAPSPWAVSLTLVIIGLSAWGAANAARGIQTRVSFRLVMAAAILLAVQLALTGLGTR